jgi:hypothetical protein
LNDNPQAKEVEPEIEPEVEIEKPVKKSESSESKYVEKGEQAPEENTFESVDKHVASIDNFIASLQEGDEIDIGDMAFVVKNGEIVEKK